VKLFALVLLILLVPVHQALGDWESLGPEGGEVRHVLQSRTDANTLYGFSDGSPTKVVRSTDGGSSWSMIGSFNNTEYCSAIASNGNIYAGCGHAFATSTNGGVSWTVTSVSNVYFYGLAIHPTTPTTVYAATYRYNGSAWVLAFMKSTNSGSTWSYVNVGPTDSYGQSISVSQANPNLMFLSGYIYTGSTYQPVVYRSTDGGTSWSDVTPAGTTAEYYSYSVAVSPTDQNLVLFATYYNIYRSTDGGTTWTKVTANQYYNYCITFSAADPNLVYSGGYGSIYRSTNAGLTWTSYATGLPSQPFQGLAADWSNATRAFTGCLVGFYRSTTTGSSWLASNTGLLLGKIYAIAVAPTQPARAFIQIYGLGVWLTNNSGTTWTHLTTPLACGDFCGMVVSPTDANTVLALEGGG
jgi:photosystem II stability/assembly factor-like uncharacterized protein